MRYKKIVLSIIASVLCLGLLSGCGGYSHDFNSSEEAQKYVLAKLKDKYNEEFTIKEVKKYKEEKIGLNWISVEVSSKENSSQTATVYARNTGLFEDSYHVYYYSDEIEELATPLFQDKPFIRNYQLEVQGHTTTTEWNGKIEGIYRGYNTYYGGNGVSTQAPVFEYMYNGIQYHEQTTQNISYKLLTQNMRDGDTYSIYVDPKHPAVFILQKKIKVSAIITVVFGIIFFSSGIATLCAIFPIFWSIIK